uniref:Meckelin n=4 Tax=Meloidogyne TaxID=189290 RepID=A0A915NW80_9BILA
MECTSCNRLTLNENEDECVCQLGTINKGDEIEGKCEKCENGLAINKNNEFCVYCLNINGSLLQPDNNGKCPNCEKDEILQITGKKDGIPTEQCIKCPKGTISDYNGEYCILCKNDFECFCNNFGQFISETIFQKVQNTAFLCQQQKSSKHCQQLANFCTLQDYPRRMDGNGENCCALLEQIKKQFKSEIAKQLIPQLFYTNIEASAEIFREGAINGIFTFSEEKENQKNTKLEIIAMTFNNNGKFLGEWTVSNGEYPILQICNLENPQQKREEAFKFGRYFQQKCQLSLLDILRWNKIWEEEKTKDYKNEEKKFIFGTKTIFFELYLRYRNEEGMIALTQIPILNEDLKGDQYIGLYGNRLGDNILKSNARLLLTKRFYLVDIQKNIKIKEGDNNNEQQQQQNILIRVPKRISLHIHFDQTFDGHIYTPYLQLSHFQYLFKFEKNIKNNTQLLTKTILTTKFSIEYHTESYTYDKCIEVIMATLCSLAAVWAALQTYSWSRRSGKLILIDASTIIKLLFFGADYIGNIFIGVMGSACIWLIYAYKLQTNIHYIPLNGNQENSFVAYMISALALKGIALLHTMRTYLIANEWNELQLYRKTNIGIQLILMLFVMEYLNFGEWAKVQPDNQPIGVIETKMSRFAINLSFYLIIGITQWIIQVIVIERLADPFRNFMDLCSVANISVLALTHPLRGYYIHGRSVHGYADTDMLQMNTFLQREKENVCALRGLESGADLQTFICNLPYTFNERINQILEGMNLKGIGDFNGRLQQKSGQFERTTIKMQQQTKIYKELNNYLKDFINRVDPKCGEYKCIDENFIEEMLNMELIDTGKIGTFRRDKSEMAYSSAFIYGNEWALMSFELLLFCVVDMFWLNRIFASVFVYLISKLILLITKIYFTNQLAKSCLIDSRFLI